MTAVAEVVAAAGRLVGWLTGSRGCSDSRRANQRPRRTLDGAAKTWTLPAATAGASPPASRQ